MLDPNDQVLPLEDLLKTVRGYVAKRYRTHHLAEDLIQESAIYTWKKHEKGGSDLECFMAGKRRASSLLHSIDYGTNKDVFTGTPNRRPALGSEAAGEVAREKIRAYLTNYGKLHDAKPSVSQISKDLGIARTTVRHHLGRLYLFAGPEMDNPYFVDIDDALQSSRKPDDPPPSWIDQVPTVEIDEDALALKLDVTEALKNVRARDKQFLYLSYWEDKSDTDIGKALGCKGNYVNKMRNRILGQIRTSLEPV